MFELKASPTPIVVSLIIGIALFITAFQAAGWKGGLVLSVILAYEGWTLINQFPNDTISEIIWKLSSRPMVPWLFGVGTGWAITSGHLANVWLILAAGFLQGHFFFQEVKD